MKLILVLILSPIFCFAGPACDELVQQSTGQDPILFLIKNSNELQLACPTIESREMWYGTLTGSELKLVEEKLLAACAKKTGNVVKCGNTVSAQMFSIREMNGDVFGENKANAKKSSQEQSRKALVRNIASQIKEHKHLYCCPFAHRVIFSENLNNDLCEEPSTLCD